MPQPMPVIRQLHLPSLLPQAVVITVLTFIIHVSAPHTHWSHAVFFAALMYLASCRILRATLTRHQIAGMIACRANRFDDAIRQFQASYEFFSTHRTLDSLRAWIFGVASANPYRIIALCNMAFCYGQMGNGHKAAALYEQALTEAPDCTLAKVSLNMLHSTSADSIAKENA